jgi:hypothetical protein
MDRRSLLRFGFLVLLLMPAFGTRVEIRGDSAAPAIADKAQELDQKILATAKDHPQVMANLSYLSDMIGARLTGSPALKRASEWTAEKMKSYGLVNVHLEPWTIPVGWQRGLATARIIEPDNGCQLAIASLGWSPGTKGRIEADVVVMGAQNASELASYKGKLKQAIVLSGKPAAIAPLSQMDLMAERGRPSGNRPPRDGNRENNRDGNRENNRDSNRDGNRDIRADFRQRMAFRQEVKDFLAAEGVAAVFMDAGKPQGLLNMTGSWKGSDRASAADPIPQLFVAHEQYALLYRLASRSAPAKTRVAIDVHNEFIPGPVTVYNTVGEIRGSEKPDEAVIIGAHLDSWDLGQGTTDNGTGSAVVLEAARVLSKCGVRPKRTIRFILFTGEEQGMRGSHAYVDQHKSELPKVSMCVVHDLGTGKVNGLGLMGHENMQKLLEGELVSLKPIGMTRFGMMRMGGSDHAPFDQSGVPGFYFLQDPAEYRLTHHSQSDTFDKANEADLVQGAQVMAVLAMRVANLAELLPRVSTENSPRRREAAAR